MSDKTFLVFSSNGTLLADKLTGLVLSRQENEPGGEISKIVKFDLFEWLNYHSAELVRDEVDILDIGYWLSVDGQLVYESPATDWRNEMITNEDRLIAAVKEAEVAFWNTFKYSYPEIKNGVIEPELSARLNTDLSNYAYAYIEKNLPYKKV